MSLLSVKVPSQQQQNWTEQHKEETLPHKKQIMPIVTNTTEQSVAVEITHLLMTYTSSSSCLGWKPVHQDRVHPNEGAAYSFRSKPFATVPLIISRADGTSGR